MRERGRVAAVVLAVLAAGAIGWWLGSRGAPPPSAEGGATSADVARLETKVADLERRLAERDARPPVAVLERSPSSATRPPPATPGKPDAPPAPVPPASGAPGEPARVTIPLMQGLLAVEPKVVVTSQASEVDGERLATLRESVLRDEAGVERELRALLRSRDPKQVATAIAVMSEFARREWMPTFVEALNDPTIPVDRRVSLANVAARAKDKLWSALQLTGAPDTPADGDIGTAWASKQQEMGEVWIDLDYPRAVRVDAVRIRETMRPGAVARVYAKDPQGAWDLLWEGLDPTRESPGWFEPAVRSTRYATSHLRIIVDTNRVEGWNELDAVELVGDGERQWASDARAQSSYSD